MPIETKHCIDLGLCHNGARPKVCSDINCPAQRTCAKSLPSLLDLQNQSVFFPTDLFPLLFTNSSSTDRAPLGANGVEMRIGFANSMDVYISPETCAIYLKHHLERFLGEQTELTYSFMSWFTKILELFANSSRVFISAPSDTQIVLEDDFSTVLTLSSSMPEFKPMQQLITNGSVPVGHDRGNLVILHAINSNEAVELASLVSQHPQRYWDQLQKTKPSSSLSMALKDFAFFSQDNPRCEYLKHLASCSYGLKLIPEDDLESNPDIFIICNGELATVSIYDDYYELFWELCCGNDTKVNYQTHVKEDGEAIRKAIYFKPSTNEDGLTSITALINPSQTEVLTNTLCVFHIDDNYQVVTNDIQQDLKKGKKRKRKKIKTKVLEHKKQPRKPKRVKVIQKHTQEVVAKTNPSNELTRTQRRKNTKTPKSTYLDIKRAYIHSSGHRNGKSN